MSFRTLRSCSPKRIFLNTENEKNACTKVPTVFLRHGKTEFKLPVSFFVYPRRRKWEIKSLFLFSFSKYKLELLFSFFTFPLLLRQQNCNCHFRFASSVFVWHGKTEFELRFLFLVFMFYYVISRQ